MMCTVTFLQQHRWLKNIYIYISYMINIYFKICIGVYGHTELSFWSVTIIVIRIRSNIWFAFRKYLVWILLGSSAACRFFILFNGPFSQMLE
jgi:hypothetical protein